MLNSMIVPFPKIIRDPPTSRDEQVKNIITNLDANRETVRCVWCSKTFRKTPLTDIQRQYKTTLHHGNSAQTSPALAASTASGRRATQER